MGERGPVRVRACTQVHARDAAAARARPQRSVAPRGLSTRPMPSAPDALVRRRRPGATGRASRSSSRSQVVSSSAARSCEPRGDVAGRLRRRGRHEAARTTAAGSRCARRRARRRRAPAGPRRRARSAASRVEHADPAQARLQRAGELEVAPRRRRVGAQLAQLARAASAARCVERERARRRLRRYRTGSGGRQSCSLTRCARSLRAANAIVPGAKPTPAQSALMSWRWL